VSVRIIVDEAEERSCRICFEGPSEEEPLFRPCKCRGSVAFLHYKCLARWVAETSRTHCELCESPFRVPEGNFPPLASQLRLNKMLSARAALHQGILTTHILSLLPSTSGPVNFRRANSYVMYVGGFAPDSSCWDFGRCKFQTDLPEFFRDGSHTLTPDEWEATSTRLNKAAAKMVNMTWRFFVFVFSLIMNVALIVILSIVDHVAMVPFMFAVILIQLLPALLFVWVATHHNAGVHTQLNAICSDFNQTYQDKRIQIGFYAITVTMRSRWDPFSLYLLGEPKMVKFLAIDTFTF